MTNNVCNCEPRAYPSVVKNPAVMSPIVEIENLARRFGALTAVDSLTVTANAGEVFGLFGSNGAQCRNTP